MMATRRVVVVLRAEKLLKPKRRGKRPRRPADDDDERAGERSRCARGLRPEARAVDDAGARRGRRRSHARLYKAIQKHATIVECWGLKRGKDARGIDLRQAARQAEQLVKKAVAEAGQQIEPRGGAAGRRARRHRHRRLRGDVERLMLYAAGKPKITLADAQEVVSAEIVAGRLGRHQRDSARQRGRGAAPAGAGARRRRRARIMILGQLAWFVREKLATTIRAGSRPRSRRCSGRISTSKSSGGDPRVLLERLVVELCR